jgi:ribosome-associated heat shock protein Hsp15
MRIDKFLWSVRLYKTRTDATEACRCGRVAVRAQAVKPSSEVKQGDAITVTKNPVHYCYKVVAMPSSRVGAKLVSGYITDITPQAELDKLNANSMVVFAERDRGSGRPTKRDRRQLESIKSYE